ncbi:MAG: hypothetical protein GXP53_12035 [Deltaproteobacteria bacterium]|nr:hypothetical protein [Deltaproteobacteria bacterium]
MNQALNQINITFNPVEDRLLLRVCATGSEPENPAEFRMWLTRRYVRLLWAVFEKVLDDEVEKIPQYTPDNKGVIRRLQQEADLSQADFSTPYKTPDSPATPLGEAPLLLSKIRLSKNSGNHPVLYLNTEADKGINLTLNTQLVNSMMKLLAQTTDAAQWNLGLMSRVADTAQKPPPGMLM